MAAAVCKVSILFEFASALIWICDRELSHSECGMSQALLGKRASASDCPHDRLHSTSTCVLILTGADGIIVILCDAEAFVTPPHSIVARAPAEQSF